MKVAIIGNGVVGQAFGKMVESHYKVLVYDPQYKSASKNEINKCDLGVVCVPTSMDKALLAYPYPCDTSIVEKTVAWLETPVILIKSTVEVGTTERLKKKYKKRIVMSPEYIGESSYYLPNELDYKDMKKVQWNIIGGDDEDVSYVFDLLVPILGPAKNYYTCTATEAELIKYMENSYFALKVAFANEMYDLVELAGANWYRVWEGWALDRRVDRLHTAVYPKKRGFAGKCYPKDVNALCAWAKLQGYKAQVLEAVLESNKAVRKKAGLKCEYDSR